MTTTSELDSQLASQISSCIDSSGTLVLPGDALGSATMAAVFQQYLTDDELIIASALVTSSDTAVTVTGLGLGRFSSLEVTAVFTPTDNSDISVVVTGISPPSWTFSIAFTTLAGGIYDQVYIQSNSVLSLRTLPDATYPAGLYFDGTLLTTSGLLLAVSVFLTEGEQIEISGAIDVTSGIPSFKFNTPAKQNMTVGNLIGLNFGLNVNSIPYQYDNYTAQNTSTPTYTQDAYLSLSTTLSFATKDNPGMSVVAEMRFGVGSLCGLTVNIDGSPGVILETFETWAGKTLQLGMPDKDLFDPSDVLTIDGLNFDILKTTSAMSNFDLMISAKKDWVIVEDIITITNISQTLTSISPADKPSITGLLSGTVDLGKDGSVAKLVVNACVPDFTIWGQLQDGCVVDVSSLVTYLIPSAVGIPQIDLTLFEFSAQPSTTRPVYSIAANFETDWVLDLSPVKMAVKNAFIELTYAPTSEDASATCTTTGTVGGSIEFNDTITFDIAYQIPGSFSINGNIPQLSLSSAISRLVDMPMNLPPGFDLRFSGCSVSIVYGNAADPTSMQFEISALVDGLGTLSFEALRVSNQWGYTTGLNMGRVSLAKVPGLSALAPFVSFFQFKDLSLLVSTSDMPSFTIPDTSTITKIVRGMNAPAKIDLSLQKQLALLQNFLKLDLSLDINLQVGLDDVGSGSSLTASMNGNVNSNMQITGTFGAKLVGDVLNLELMGSLTTSLQGQPITFDFGLGFVENGAYLYGGFDGTIDFVIVKLSNLMVEIGIDWEGLPSIGFCAQIDTVTYETSIMVLLDSMVPTQSMFVGSISNISLATYLQTLCNITDTNLFPQSMMSLLEAVSISGTAVFTLADADGSLTTSLNNRDVAKVSAAFATVNISLPSDSLQVIISVSKENSLWFVTDLVSVTHYELTKDSGATTINGSVNPQLYVVPQDTQIGTTTVKQGLRANAALNLFGFSAALAIEIDNGSGFSIDAQFSRMIIKVSGCSVLTFESDDDNSSAGPSLSVCTFQKGSTPPHFCASGSLNILGVVGMGVEMDFTPTGGEFKMTANASGANFTLGGSYNSEFACSVNGSADIGVDSVIDFGALGSIHVQTSMGYTFAVATTSIDSGSVSASGYFEFSGSGFSVPQFTIPISEQSLISMVEGALSEVTASIASYLANYQAWLNWLYGNVMIGIDSAEQVGQILDQTYTLAYDTIATETTDILKYSADQVAKCLDGAGATTDEAMEVMVNTLNYSVDVATSAIENAFTGYHCDMTVFPHTDMAITPHWDVGVPHSDSKSYCDVLGVGGKTHWDVKGTHTDSPEQHSDTKAVHTDFTT